MDASDDRSQDSGTKRKREDDQQVNSTALEASVQQIQTKIEQFTLLVSGLLEAGKSIYTEASNAFEENILSLHQKQIEKWEEEILELRALDTVNEDMNTRLNNAQSLMASVHGGHSGMTLV